MRTLPLVVLLSGCVGTLTVPEREREPAVGFDAGLSLDAAAPPPAQPDASPPPADAFVPPPDARPRDAAPPPRDASPLPRDRGVTPEPGQDECGDVRQASKVYNGTRTPTAIPLTPGQILAIGSFNGCTGTLITPTWVLSATHCEHQPGVAFCVGADPAQPNLCVRARAVFSNPQADQDLLELERPLAEVAPGVTPIPIMTEPMNDSWRGRTAEAAGYGQTERGQFNVRWFTAQPIVQLSQPYLTIDGEGERGVCFGDSGGPVLVRAADGTVRVAGDLSHGDPSCLGQDNYTRTDLFVSWIEQHTGPTVVDGGGPAPCGAIDAAGRCDGQTAEWCVGGQLNRERCDRCGWDAAAGGFRCVGGPDPCAGYDARGACEGAVARWCEQGEPKRRDCGRCGQMCTTGPQGATCADDPCEVLDYLGACEGDVAVWCDNAGYHRHDCAEQNLGCGYVDEQVGYYCQ